MKNPKILCDEKFYTLHELQSHVGFFYLPKISFASSRDEKEVKKKGLFQLKNHKVCNKSQKLGKKYINLIENAYISKVSIRRLSENLGYGLFLEENLDAGSYVGEYTGIVRKNDRRYFEPLNNYCYEYPVLDSIGRSYVIDATQGNLTRFINHSYQPNLQPIYVFHEGFYHVIFITLHPIKKGSQLCFNYGKNYWYLRGNPIDF